MLKERLEYKYSYLNTLALSLFVFFSALCYETFNFASCDILQKRFLICLKLQGLLFFKK